MKTTNCLQILRLPRAAARRALLLAALLPAAALPVRAQYIMEFAQTYNAPMSNFISGTVNNNLAMINAATPEARRPSSIVLRAEGAPQAQRNARELAQRFPAPQRDKMEQAYLQSFDVYRKLEAKFGWSNNDVAGALAAFVVGNYMVFNATDVPDEQFAAVAEQLRRDPALGNTFGGQGQQGLRAMYEQSAMVGTFMALAQMSQKQQPQPAAQRANLRDSARANLRQVLGTDPARLQLSSQGMRLR